MVNPMHKVMSVEQAIKNRKISPNGKWSLVANGGKIICRADEDIGPDDYIIIAVRIREIIRGFTIRQWQTIESEIFTYLMLMGKNIAPEQRGAEAK